MDESDDTADNVENTDDADDDEDTEEVEGMDEMDSGVETVECDDEPLSPRACSGSGVESAINLLQVLSGRVPKRLCCSGVRYAKMEISCCGALTEKVYAHSIMAYRLLSKHMIGS